jgi:uncharacterized protein YgiM (DUF1202 family)
MESQKTIDDLLYEVSREKTSELALPLYLNRLHTSEVYQKACATRKIKRNVRHLTAIAAALLLVLACAAASFSRAIVVEGKTYLAFDDKVIIDDKAYNLNALSGKTSLVRLMNSNQYVITAEQEQENAAPAIMVFPPESEPLPLKNPDFIPSKHEKPLSIEPVIVYPTVGDLKVREGPDTEYAELYTLHSGQCVTKIGTYGNWAIIEWDGNIAYTYDAYLYEAPKDLPVYPAIEKYATEPVNIRSLPTSRDESAILHELQTGERVMCTGKIGEWSQIQWNGGTTYVFSKYLSGIID